MTITKAMILAAGRGERMRPLTDTCPKPLLKVASMPLIEHHIRKLQQLGIVDIVINHAWLGEKIEQYFGKGERWGVNIRYSQEYGQALETAGGIIKALPLLLLDNPSEQFLVINGDVYTELNFANIPPLKANMLAHLCLVSNPLHNPEGDFTLSDGILSNKALQQTGNNRQKVTEQTFTYSGIGLYHSDFFKERASEQVTTSAHKLALGPLLRESAALGRISASVIDELWTDVGTPERLQQLNKQLKNKSF